MQWAVATEALTEGIGTMADPKSPSAFLSYSHDSTEHADRVLALAYALRDRGIDVILDRFVHPAPAEGWPLWMERNLKAADFVVLVCTATYCRRVRAEEMPGQGTGVRWEGRIVYNHLCYGDDPGGIRFIPILLPGAEPTHIPDPVRGHNYYRITVFDLSDAGFDALYRHLTDQPAALKPDLGAVVSLPPQSRPQPLPGPLPPSGGPTATVPGATSSASSGLDDRIRAEELGKLLTLDAKPAGGSFRHAHEYDQNEQVSEKSGGGHLGGTITVCASMGAGGGAAAAGPVGAVVGAAVGAGLGFLFWLARR